jgi:GTPase-associated system-like protein
MDAGNRTLVARGHVVDTEFRDWYRVVAIEPRPELLEQRWHAIEDVVRTLDVPGVLDLVRLFYGSALAEPRFLERYREAFRAVDGTFPLHDNEAELRILAGATILALLEHRGGAVADIGAQAAACADCRGHRPGDRPPGFLHRVRQYLSARGAAVRAAPDLTSDAKPILATEALLARMEALLDLPAPARRGPANGAGGIEALLEGSYGLGAASPQPVAGAGGSPLASLVVAVLDVAAATTKIAEEHAERLRLHREQLGVLWWLVAEYSRDLGHEMQALPLPVACLVAGKELADLTGALPGPLGAIGALDRMLRAVEPQVRSATTIREAVGAAPRPWSAAWVASAHAQPLEAVCPVILAVGRSLEPDRGDDWGAPVKDATGIDVDAPIHPLDLAGQAYEEALLLRFVAASG